MRKAVTGSWIGLFWVAIAAFGGQPVHALKVGQALPEFARPGLESGNLLRSGHFRGRVIYLDFWASWCGPCRISLPAMDKIYRDLSARGLTVIAVNLDEEVEDAKAFLRDHPVSYHVVRDDGSLPKRFEIKGMPTAYLIDRSGRVRAVHEGFRRGDAEKVRRLISQLLDEDSRESASR